jgi:hypothetical protein
MKTRVSRSEDVRRAIIHEERSSSPPDFQMFSRMGDSPNGQTSREPEMNPRTIGPDMKKEGDD